MKLFKAITFIALLFPLSVNSAEIPDHIIKLPAASVLEQAINNATNNCQKTFLENTSLLNDLANQALSLMDIRQKVLVATSDYYQYLISQKTPSGIAEMKCVMTSGFEPTIIEAIIRSGQQ